MAAQYGTTTGAVQNLLGYNYGALPNGDLPDLQQYIDAADVMLANAVVYAGYKNNVWSAANLEMLERYLSAHFYAMMDRTYKGRATMGSSGQFDGNTDMMLQASMYGQMACRLDPYGILESWGRKDRGHADGAWLGSGGEPGGW
jgi:hypothetical protein